MLFHKRSVSEKMKRLFSIRNYRHTQRHHQSSGAHYPELPSVLYPVPCLSNFRTPIPIFEIPSYFGCAACDVISG